MQETGHLDDNTLAAFVDGQLDPESTATVAMAVSRDPSVAERVSSMRRAKDIMRVGFATARAPTRGRPASKAPTLRKYLPRLAASAAVLSLAGVSASVGYHFGRHADQTVLEGLVAAEQEHSDRVILHVSDNNPAQFAAALRYAEKFLQQHSSPESRVELIANAGGLNMMRAGLSPYRRQIGALADADPRLKFLACANAIANLRKQGIEPHLIAGIETDKKAIDHIVERLQAGWSYVRVDSLPEI